MPENYEPLPQVRKSFQVNWYRCPIEPAKLRELTSRSDLRDSRPWDLFFFSRPQEPAPGFSLTTGSGWLCLALFSPWDRRLLHRSGTHELSHGTVFKTKWLNTFFLYALALISWFNPRDFKLSHTYHHLYTLHPRADREVVLPTKPSCTRSTCCNCSPST